MISVVDVFEEFKKKKVLIVGDVMLDSYTYGTVKRISPEAPVPIVNVKKREKRLGGAANVALNIKSLGAYPILCSVVGDDIEGNEIKRLLNDENITCEGIIKSQNRITTVKKRVLSGTQQLIRIDTEMTDQLLDIDKKALLQHIRNLIKECDLVIFEDYDKGVLDPELISQTLVEANNRQIYSVVDPKKKNFFSYRGVSLFKPNLHELKDGLGIEFDEMDQSALENAISLLDQYYDTSKKLITLSEKGVYYQDRAVRGYNEAHLRSIADVSGAGDTVISIAGLALTLDLPLNIVAELSNLGGGIVCESAGVVSIDKTKLMNEAIQNKKLIPFFDKQSVENS